MSNNSMHVNIANNRWALKVLYNPISSNQSTYIIQTIPSSRTTRPQTIIEINSSIQTNSLIVVRQHLLNDTIATIIQSTISSLDNNQILTADIVAQTIQYNKNDNSSQCSICFGDFIISDILLQLTCKHIYHRECLLHWLQTHYRCPYCRFLVYQQPVTPHIFLIRQTIT
ncbi:unnamed protein product [Rotaria sp. Silwood2]|nr:unnamed protein product [Rotaria sp. Silwood2]CAF3159655.1 unnamed protein product [Rotaria sp. Silwood2]CAF4083097.1 unnamed protein product [Rotaria sp. Silwood2]CAF4415313.1 unnamed protein product [Rotaria sp. Silwood2]